MTLFAAIALGGIGIWSMHVVGMTAYKGGEFGYDGLFTLLSFVIPIGAIHAGLWMVVGSQFNYVKLIVAGIIVGLAVVVMHYTGIAAMEATISYDMTLVYVSIAIAVVAATAALWLMVHVSGFVQTLFAALVMGVAVCGMHYTGMAAATIKATNVANFILEGNFFLLALVTLVDVVMLTIVGLLGFMMFSDLADNNRKTATA